MKARKRNTQVIDIKTALANAKKLQEGEKLELVDKLYTCDVDETTGEITVTIKANLADVVRSAKGSNFIVPLANTKGVRGSGVITATSEKGVSCKIYADRLYLSTVEIEKEKASKNTSKNDSEKALLKANLEQMQQQNAMLMELLAKNGLLEK